MSGPTPGSHIQGWCPLCDGPCKEPLQIPAVHDRYPFLTDAQKRLLSERAAPPPPPEPTPAAVGRRRREDRMRRLQETTARHPSEVR